MADKKDIIERLNELEEEGNEIIQHMQQLKVYYHQGYRFVDLDDKPISGLTNVTNIAEYRK